jgi:streptogramin lyase
MTLSREKNMAGRCKAIVGAIGAAALVVTAALQPQARAATSTATADSALVGVVHDEHGKPMAGVAVSARSSAQTFTTSVYTDEHGEYVFPPLAAGQYLLWAQAVTYATGRSQVTLAGGKAVHNNLALKPLDGYEQQLTGLEWYDALPDDTVDHRRLKQVMYVACSGCHGLDLVLQNRFDEAGWKAILRGMESAWFSGWRGAADLPPHQLRWQEQIIRHHRDELAAFLAEVRGPGTSPMKPKPMDRPRGEAARVVVTEYDLPISARRSELPWYTGADWMDGPSTGMHGIIGTHDVTVDAAGYAWIAHSGGRSTFESDRALIKLDPANGAMTAIKLLDKDGKMVTVEQISRIDEHGTIWMHSDDTFLRLDTTQDKFTAYPMPPAMGGMENSTEVDANGRGWANARAGVVMLDPAGSPRAGDFYPGWKLFQQNTPGDGITYGITTDAENNVWWSESYVDKVATRNMVTGKVVEFDMRDPDYDARKALAKDSDLAFYESVGGGTWSPTSASPVPYANMPRRLAADKNGDKVWVPNWAQSTIAEIDIHSYKINYHRLPIHVHPYKTVVDKFHNVWTDTSMIDGAMRYTPATGEWAVFRLPSHGCGSRHMGFDDYRNEAWIACDQSSKVARIQFRSDEDIRKRKAAIR